MGGMPGDGEGRPGFVRFSARRSHRPAGGGGPRPAARAVREARDLSAVGRGAAALRGATLRAGVHRRGIARRDAWSAGCGAVLRAVQGHTGPPGRLRGRVRPRTRGLRARLRETMARDRVPRDSAALTQQIHCHAAFMPTAPAARWRFAPERHDDTTTTTLRTQPATSARGGIFVNGPATDISGSPPLATT